MQCPVCDDRLRAIEKNGLLIDMCPGCKGAWIDRTELEKVLAILSDGPQAASLAPDAAARPRGEDKFDGERDRPQRSRRNVNDSDDDDDYDDRPTGRNDKDGRGRRRGGFLSNVMDMFGD